MGAFLDSWKSGVTLERDELIAMMRSFTLAVLRTAAIESGLSPEGIATLARRGQIQGPTYKQGKYDPVDGWKVYFKQFLQTSDLYERTVIELDPPLRGDWGMGIMVSTEPTGTGHRIKEVLAGLLRWSAAETGLEERITSRAVELSAGQGLVLTTGSTMVVDGRRWGAYQRLTEWSQDEEALINHLGHLLATLLPVLQERRTWTVEASRRFVTARFATLRKRTQVIGQVPSGGSWELKLSERDARQLASHGLLIEARFHAAQIRLRLTLEGRTHSNFTSCEGAFASIGDLGAAMDVRLDDRVWLVQGDDGLFTLDRAAMPILLVPPGAITTQDGDGRRLELIVPPRLDGRICQWQNGIARGEYPEIYLTDGERVTQRGTIQSLTEGESLAVTTGGLEPFEMALVGLRVADTWEPLRASGSLQAAYDRTLAPASLRPGRGQPGVAPRQTNDLQAIIAAFEAEPSLVYDHADLINLATALTALPHKHFVILHGPSGTGKSQFAQAYANALYGRNLRAPGNPSYKAIPVQPTWQDRGPLLGYFNPLTGRYEVPDFLAHLLAAIADPAHPYILCLDEMNLAVVEHYFADFLSAWESREPITLHRQGDGLALPEQVTIPPNFYVIGTVNIDETTHGFSPKVLDRAFPVELAGKELSTVIDRLIDSHGDLAPALRPVGNLLREIQYILEPEGLGFAYRTAEEILAFVAQIAATGWLIPQGEAIDRIVHQKILPKLRGDDRRAGALKRLDDRIELALREAGGDPDNSRSRRALARMRESAERYGTFQFWG